MIESRPDLFEMFYLFAEEGFLRFEEVVGAKGFEPSTSWSRISSRNTYLIGPFGFVLRQTCSSGPVFGSNRTQIGLNY